MTAERELVIVEIMRQREKPWQELSNEALMELAQRGIELAESLGYGAEEGEAMSKRRWLLAFLLGALGNVGFYAWQHDRWSLAMGAVCIVMAIVVQITAPEASR